MNTPAISALPTPRWRINKNNVVDRWTGRNYSKSPTVLVNLLNQQQKNLQHDAAAFLEVNLGDAAVARAELQEIRESAKQDAIDAQDTLQVEAQANTILAEQLVTLQDAVRAAAAAMKEGRYLVALDLLRVAVPENTLAGNPFDRDDRLGVSDAK